MSTESSSPDGGAMTVDQAIESLTTTPEPEQPAAPVEAAVGAVAEPDSPSEAEPTAEAPSEPEEVNAEGEEAEAEEPAQPAIDPPPFWDADAKAAFASLTPEHQTIVSAQASKQATEASQAIQKAAERAKSAETQAARVSDLATGLNEFLPKAVETFKGRWDGIDWAAWADQDPTEAFKGKVAFEAEQKDIQRLTDARDQADRLAAEQFVATEFAKLPEVAPDLVDPKEGPARRTALASYLLEHGVTREQLPNISAVEMSIAYKAMQFDKLKAAPPKVALKPPTPAARPPARPGAASPTPNRASTAAARYAQTRSVDDAVALLMAPKG
jgi:hypothetical protein